MKIGKFILLIIHKGGRKKEGRKELKEIYYRAFSC